MTIRRLMTGILEFEVVDTVSNDEIRKFLDMLEEEAAEYQAGVIMDTTKRTGRSEHADIFAEQTGIGLHFLQPVDAVGNHVLVLTSAQGVVVTQESQQGKTGKADVIYRVTCAITFWLAVVDIVVHELVGVPETAWRLVILKPLEGVQHSSFLLGLAAFAATAAWACHPARSPTP